MAGNAATAMAVDAVSGGLRLILDWRGRSVPLTSDDELLIGRDPDIGLPLDGAFLSRRHAVLRWNRSAFELHDHSTNGVFVQYEDEQIRFVHRDVLRLWGSGYLSFGEPPSPANAVRFRHG